MANELDELTGPINVAGNSNSKIIDFFGSNGIREASNAFGTVGLAALKNTSVNLIVVANDNPITSYRKPELNSKKLLTIIDQLSVMDNLFKYRLNSQRLAYENNKLIDQENRIEFNKSLENIKDAERSQTSSNSGLGMLGLAGLGLLAYDPVMNIIKSLVDFTVDAGKFISDTTKQITGFFESFLPEAPKEEEEVVNSPITPNSSFREQAEAATVWQPPQTPEVKPAAEPVKKSPSLREQTEGISYKKPTVTQTTSEKTTPPVKQKDTRSWWERNAPSWAGGKSAPTTKKQSKESNKEVAAGKIIKVSHPETGEGWGIAGATDQRGRPVVFSKEGAEAFYRMMIDSNGAVKPSDVASSKRSLQKNKQVDGATNSPHLRGVAMDIHGSSNKWIRQHGHKYGWNPHDYKGTHGGHFKFKGAGLSTDQGEASDMQTMAQTLISKGTQAVDNTLTNMATAIGTIGGKVVGPGVARSLTTASPDFAKLISNEAATQTAEIAKIKESANKPVAPAIPAPPNISTPGAAGIQNIPTMVDRNSVQYYLNRFGYKETNSPIKATG